MPETSDDHEERIRLEKELREAEAAYEQEYSLATSTWATEIGSFTVRTRLDNGAIVSIYIAFNCLCFIVGVVFTLLSGVLQALGVALVVGGLFSFGTFMAQWWDHAWQREREIVNRMFGPEDGDERYARLRRLAKEYRELWRRFEQAPSLPDENHNTE